jgi:hypothetical protein
MGHISLQRKQLLDYIKFRSGYNQWHFCDGTPFRKLFLRRTQPETAFRDLLSWDRYN